METGVIYRVDDDDDDDEDDDEDEDDDDDEDDVTFFSVFVVTLWATA